MNCTDAKVTVTSNTGTFGSVASFTGTFPLGNLKPGSDITCVITNTKTQILR